MSTPLDWENRPQQFPEPVTQEDVEDELAEMFRCLGDMAGQKDEREAYALRAEVAMLRGLLEQVIAEDIAAAIGHGLSLMLHTMIADVLARRS